MIKGSHTFSDLLEAKKIVPVLGTDLKFLEVNAQLLGVDTNEKC